MAYVFQDDIAGLPPIRSVDTGPRGAAYAGMLGHAVDPVLGGGEFLYLPGVANTVLGSLVTYNQATPSTTLAATGAKVGSPVAVAMAAIGAGQYGWYQITGQAQIAKVAGALSAGASVGVSATPGAVAASAGGPATAGALSGVIAVLAASGDATVTVGISRPTVLL